MSKFHFSFQHFFGSILIFLPILFFIFLIFFLRFADIEDKCVMEAKKIVGNQWCDLRESDNKDSINYIEGKPPGMCRGYYEELRCEGKQKTFFLF